MPAPGDVLRYVGLTQSRRLSGVNRIFDDLAHAVPGNERSIDLYRGRHDSIMRSTIILATDRLYT